MDRSTPGFQDRHRTIYCTPGSELQFVMRVRWYVAISNFSTKITKILAKTANFQFSFSFLSEFFHSGTTGIHPS